MKILKNRTFTWWQVGLLKSCLISAGILLGVYFKERLIGLVWLWWAIFAVIGLYFIARFFRNDPQV